MMLMWEGLVLLYRKFLFKELLIKSSGSRQKLHRRIWILARNFCFFFLSFLLFLWVFCLFVCLFVCFQWRMMHGPLLGNGITMAFRGFWICTMIGGFDILLKYVKCQWIPLNSIRNSKENYNLEEKVVELSWHEKLCNNSRCEFKMI